ncbi:M6 family metalloprotease domain-containing protein [Streptomyces fradiae]|uniref:M6 family metalloprotease domain-containing protein n=1 Tax=Streptomyces fradiae TaxID=1906 RepID=UPI00398612F7
MQQPTSRRRRIRQTAALGAAAAVAVGALATASATLDGPAPATAGPAASDPAAARALAESADAGSLAACRIRAEAGVQMSEGIPTPPGYTRSTGVVRALNLMIDFPDTPGEGPAMRRYREFFPQTADWFHVSSYGRLRYVPYAPVPSWLRMPLPFTEYGIDRGAPYEPGYRKLVEHIVEAADDRVDFSAYDLVNVLVTPNAGPSALDTVLSVTFSGNGEAPSADGVTLSNTSFVYSRQDDGSGSFHETGYRVLPHENGHVFGLPDLYTAEGGAAVGHWDIMSEDWGANNDLLGWHKWKLGWLDASQVRCASRPGTREYTLTPLARPGRGVKLAVVPLGELAGYALEARTGEGNDEAVCDPGVLVYRVRADVDTGQGPVTVEDGDPGSGGCTRHPNVHAELSDAPYGPGETFHDAAAGVTVTVLARERNGSYRVRVTRG